MTASRDAAPAVGAFPLIVGMLRPVSVAASAEHLASHGYVVAYVERQPREALLADGLEREALIMAEHVRDMEVAIARLRREPFVDPARLGAHGYSGDGLAQLVPAMRHSDVDAVALLETGWLSPAQVSSYQEMTAHDPLALRAPLFYAYSENLGRNSNEQIADITGMRYAARSLLYLGEPMLAALGIYGVAAYGVSRRLREIGIRMALGADRSAVVGMVLRRLGVLLGTGLVIGAVLSWWTSKYIATLLYKVEPTDFSTLAVAIGVLAAVGLVAGWLPARRAAGVDPTRGSAADAHPCVSRSIVPVRLSAPIETYNSPSLIETLNARRRSRRATSAATSARSSA